MNVSHTGETTLAGAAALAGDGALKVCAPVSRAAKLTQHGFARAVDAAAVCALCVAFALAREPAARSAASAAAYLGRTFGAAIGRWHLLSSPGPPHP